MPEVKKLNIKHSTSTSPKQSVSYVADNSALQTTQAIASAYGSYERYEQGQLKKYENDLKDSRKIFENALDKETTIEGVEKLQQDYLDNAKKSQSNFTTFLGKNKRAKEKTGKRVGIDADSLVNRKVKALKKGGDDKLDLQNQDLRNQISLTNAKSKLDGADRSAEVASLSKKLGDLGKGYSDKNRALSSNINNKKFLQIEGLKKAQLKQQEQIETYELNIQDITGIMAEAQSSFDNGVIDEKTYSTIIEASQDQLASQKATINVNNEIKERQLKQLYDQKIRMSIIKSEKTKAKINATEQIQSFSESGQELFQGSINENGTLNSINSESLTELKASVDNSVYLSPAQKISLNRNNQALVYNNLSARIKQDGASDDIKKEVKDLAKQGLIGADQFASLQNRLVPSAENLRPALNDKYKVRQQQVTTLFTTTGSYNQDEVNTVLDQIDKDIEIVRTSNLSETEKKTYTRSLTTQKASAEFAEIATRDGLLYKKQDEYQKGANAFVEQLEDPIAKAEFSKFASSTYETFLKQRANGDAELFNAMNNTASKPTERIVLMHNKGFEGEMLTREELQQGYSSYIGGGAKAVLNQLAVPEKLQTPKLVDFARKNLEIQFSRLYKGFATVNELAKAGVPVGAFAQASSQYEDKKYNSAIKSISNYNKTSAPHVRDLSILASKIVLQNNSIEDPTKLNTEQLKLMKKEFKDVFNNVNSHFTTYRGVYVSRDRVENGNPFTYADFQKNLNSNISEVHKKLNRDLPVHISVRARTVGSHVQFYYTNSDGIIKVLKQKHIDEF